MRAWLRYGDAYVASSGDLPDELFADRAQAAMAVHAQALVDAKRGCDKAGIQEAYKAMEQTLLDERERRKRAPEERESERQERTRG